MLQPKHRGSFAGTSSRCLRLEVFSTKCDEVECRGTYKVFLPAIRGCVAHEPPSAMLCLPSKKSAVEFRSLFRHGMVQNHNLPV